MIHTVVNIGMTLSVLFFVAGYVVRKSNNRRHRILMAVGMACNLLSAVVLLASVHLVYGSDMRAAGFIPTVAPGIILAHRIIATVALLLMLSMLYTGWKRMREAHIFIHRIFLPLYLVVYVSGLVIFS